MKNILFEKEVCEHLRLPAIPKKAWDNKTPFDKGIAVVNLRFGDKCYAIARFNPQKEETPTIVKVFGNEPFIDIESIFIVPDYMETDVKDADLDDASKKKAEELAAQAENIVEDGVGDSKSTLPDNQYMFDNITNDEEAVAFIEAYNKKNKIGGQVPKKHETILMRLAVIYAEQKKASGSGEIEENGDAE